MQLALIYATLVLAAGAGINLYGACEAYRNWKEPAAVWFFGVSAALGAVAAVCVAMAVR